MQKLVCDLCGGKLVMQESGVGTCRYCGIEYSISALRKKIEVSGTVEITKGESEKERLLKNGQTYINFKKYREAQQVYEKITKEFPDDWRGWIGLGSVILYSREYSLTDIKNFEDNVKIALQLTENRTEIQNKVSDIYANYAKMIINDEIGFNLGDVKEAIEYNYCFDNTSFVISLTNFFNQCKQNAETLKSSLTYKHKISAYQLFSRQGDYLVDGYVSDIIAFSPRSVLMHSKNHSNGIYGYGDVWSCKKIEDTIKKAKEVEQPFIWQASGLCKFCGGKLSLFGNKCKSCGKDNSR